MSSALTPIIVGASQFTQAKDEPKPLDPLGLMLKTSRSALADTGVNGLEDYIDMMYISYIMTLSYRDITGALSERLGIKPSKTLYPPIGGNTPQMFVNLAAHAIASGESQAILMTGGEAEYALRRFKKGAVKLDWPEKRDPDKIDGDTRYNTSDFENFYHLILPIGLYSMFEMALNEVTGRSREEHMKYIGGILEHYSSVAANAPYAWTDKSYTAEKIITPTPRNRYIYYPYTLHMMANRQVDQSAAIVMTNVKIAEKLGIDRSQWIYPMGGSDIQNIYYTSQRPLLHTSPATAHGSRLALEQAGLSLDDIDLFDLYSCFPSMIQILMREIGIGLDDPRGLTVTGGLPYFGAPMNNYSMHAIATVIERIRENPSQKAMVVAIGGMNTKPSFGIYGTESPAHPWGKRDDTELQESIFAETLPEPAEQANGQLAIETFTIQYNRNGRPETGIVMGRLEDGSRTLADIKADADALIEMQEKGLIGKTGMVRFDREQNRNFITITV